jgi:hypothetical protein
MIVDGEDRSFWLLVARYEAAKDLADAARKAMDCGLGIGLDRVHEYERIRQAAWKSLDSAGDSYRAGLVNRADDHCRESLEERKRANSPRADARFNDNHPNDPPDDFSRPDLCDPHGALAVPRWVDNDLAPGATREMEPGEPTPRERAAQTEADFVAEAVDLVNGRHRRIPPAVMERLFAFAIAVAEARRADEQHDADLADANSY